MSEQAALPLFEGSPSLERTAIHESGHAIAALALGLCVERVRVSSQPLRSRRLRSGTLGHVDGDCQIRERFAYRRMIVVLFAASEAERLLLGGVPDGAVAENDLDQARKYVKKIRPPKAFLEEAAAVEADDPYFALLAAREKFFEFLHNEAARLVSIHRAAIARVAALLLIRRTLSGPEVQRAAGELR